MSGELRDHGVVLRGDRVVLRPLREADWALLLKWNNDLAVLHFSEGDVVTSRTLQEVQEIYRSVAETAFCFLVEYGGSPVGECWLQGMNLPDIRARHSGWDCRRIDLMIGEKTHWGRGIGTESVRLLLRFAFGGEGADAVFACDVADYNQASLRLFTRLGFEVEAVIEEPPGRKARRTVHLVLTREKYLAEERRRESPSSPP